MYREAVTLMHLLAPVGLASLLSCADFCPSCPLSSCDSLASCSRHGPLLPTRLISLQVDFPERCEGSGYAAPFIFKSRAFLLELADHRLHQAFWHAGILSSSLDANVRSHRGLLIRWRTNLGRGLRGVIHLRVRGQRPAKLHPPPGPQTGFARGPRASE